MKNLRTTLLCACMLVCSVWSFGQADVARVNEPNMNKPSLFTALPEKININTASLTNLLSIQEGTDISVNLGGKMPFAGKIISSSNEAGVSSIVVLSANYPGARLIFSKAVIDGKELYSARIISMEHGDLFELKIENGQNILVKKKYYDLINE
ncbi:MAG TPA: hypothetical protein VFZ42_13720 [Chitinophagaceae bacterium]